jgi:hypothetical protein
MVGRGVTDPVTLGANQDWLLLKVGVGAGCVITGTIKYIKIAININTNPMINGR